MPLHIPIPSVNPFTAAAAAGCKLLLVANCCRLQAVAGCKLAFVCQHLIGVPMKVRQQAVLHF
jgi:hypothetical protein